MLGDETYHWDAWDHIVQFWVDSCRSLHQSQRNPRLYPSRVGHLKNIREQQWGIFQIVNPGWKRSRCQRKLQSQEKVLSNVKRGQTCCQSCTKEINAMLGRGKRSWLTSVQMLTNGKKSSTFKCDVWLWQIARGGVLAPAYYFKHKNKMGALHILQRAW